ncbi:hypothetical protein EMN47_05925 [Prolixibacteraceae bacterium JC049]|nr:hypothetical protein [Prolixibacteraceae bacterium JC049]
MNCNGCAIRNIYNSEESRRGKLDAHNWLNNLPDTSEEFDIVEVQFKNTRKAFYRNTDGLRVKRGDIVVVEANPGHDVGKVALVGKLAQLQYERKEKNPGRFELKKIYRLAKEYDLERWQNAKDREYLTLIKSRQFAQKLKLEMKISDVEFQGDERKAIFYYIADGRVDFRQLIKIYAKEFHIRVEMKQIGARQEAGMVGGIGSCGRELCCSSWRTDFSSVSSDAARIQELPPNAQKLAGQCGKLKCCLMFELDHYIEAREDFPRQLLELDLEKGRAIPVKTEVMKKVIWYTYLEDQTSPAFPLSLDQVKKIINLNKRGKQPKPRLEEANIEEPAVNGFQHGTANISSKNNRPFRKKSGNRKRKNRNK